MPRLQNDVSLATEFEKKNIVKTMLRYHSLSITIFVVNGFLIASYESEPNTRDGF